jgi:hypothetical protein
VVVMTGTGGSHKSENRPTLVRSNTKKFITFMMVPEYMGAGSPKATRERG